jgi:hypothetical protein
LDDSKGSQALADTTWFRMWCADRGLTTNLEVLENSMKLLEYSGDSKSHTATAIAILWNYCLQRYTIAVRRGRKGLKAFFLFGFM